MHPSRPGESSPPPAPTELKREPKIDFHENVVVGEANDLVVSLEDLLATTPKEQILKIALPAGASEAEVWVELAAPGFDVKAVGAPVMTVKTVRDPALERVKFTLTARSLGSEPVLREITANFWLRHTCIGAISRKTYIIPQGYNKARPGSDECVSAGFVMPNGKRVECDFLVTVQGDDEAGLPPFRLSLRSVVPGQEDNGTYMGKLVLDGAGPTLGKYLDDFYAKHFDKYPDAEDDAVFTNEFEGWRDEFMEGLRAIGQKLWTFLPERFRREYFRLHALDALPTSILVHSDEMILPWELIVPWDKVEGRLVTLEPLGRRHILGRWKPGLRTKPQPQRYRVRRFCIVNPVYPDPDTLESAAWETEQLRRLLPQVSVISPANRATVKNQVLSKDDVNVFHFNGHGEIDPNNADLNTLLLEDGGALEALQVTGSKLAVEGAPVVYLNACHAGNTSAAVGRMAGFCANFLESGCSGVIAPYWPVDDKRAAEFSVNLYQKLSKGEAIGAALRDLRREHPDDFTYAAFSYFGDPCASLDLGSMVS